MVAKKSTPKAAKLPCDKTALVARILIVGLFAMSLFGKVTGFSGQAAYASSVVTWVPGELTILVAIIMETIGVITILSGWRMSFGAGVLAAYTLLTVIFFHNFIIDGSQMVTALKNLSIMGGLLVLMMVDPGKYSFKG